MQSKLNLVRRLAASTVMSLVIVLLSMAGPATAHDNPVPDEPLNGVWVEIMPGQDTLDDQNFRYRVPDGRVPENVEVAWKASPSPGIWKSTEVDVIILGAPGYDVAAMDDSSIFVCCVRPNMIVRGDFMSPPTDLESEIPHCQWGADGFEDLWLRVYKQSLWQDCVNQPVQDGQTLVYQLRGANHSKPEIKGHDHVHIKQTNGVVKIEEGTDPRKTTALGPCYPNPFNPVTSFAVTLSRAGDYEVDIFSIQGRRVKTLAGHAAAGTTTITWDGTDAVGRSVASGLYLYRLRAGEVIETRKMMLLK